MARRTAAARPARRAAIKRPARSRVANRTKTAPQIEDLPELITVDEYMAAARLGRTAAYEQVRTGKIPIVRLGRHVRIPRSILLPATAT